MSIALNNFAEVRVDPETGEKRLFGKCGFQTMSPKTDKYTLANMAAIEAALDAGHLTDLDGNPVQDGAVITLFCRVTKVKEGSELESIGSLTNASGSVATVEAAQADSDDNPF